MRKTINPKSIYHLAKEFARNQKKTGKSRGKPAQYSLSLVLTVVSIQNLYGFSFRETLEFCGLFLGKVPTLSTFHYRVNTLNPEIVKQFIAFLGMEIQKEFHSSGKRLKFVIIDGTGFSFNDIYPLQYLRGTEVRKVKSHVRALAMVASTGKERFFVGAENGEAYASEIKMAEKLIPRFSFRKNLPFLGDKGFDSVYLLQTIKKCGALPCIKMKEGLHNGMKNPERFESKKNEKLYGDKRTLIEGLFGNVKQKTQSYQGFQKKYCRNLRSS